MEEEQKKKEGERNKWNTQLVRKEGRRGKARSEERDARQANLVIPPCKQIIICCFSYLLEL